VVEIEEEMLLRAVIGFVGVVGLATTGLAVVDRSFHDLSIGFALLIGSSLLFARSEQLRRRDQPVVVTKPALVITIATGAVLVGALGFVAGRTPDTATTLTALGGVVIVLAVLGAVVRGYRRGREHRNADDGSVS
jgi:O-antigen/teichoic acid export membrane protein